MIPALVAAEIRETVLDYLRTTWALADRELEAALFRFLEGAEDPATGIFRGPYLQLRLPFAPKPADASVPLDVRPLHEPYLHQLQAWQRLSSRDGAAPRATIVTTGTGSGKTECFLYPILDHCCRALERGEGGIKAIILYPMNALASDQARRIAKIVNEETRLDGKLRVGMYVGEEGRHREMGADFVIDNREILRKAPPDILLTNYRMLDLLLLRPKDQALWSLNRPGTLRYLVLDELHTYDGAQGTDVACLIRRLAARLGEHDSICPVGTSATVASEQGDTQRELLEFASKVFDQPFDDDAVIGDATCGAADSPAAATRPTEVWSMHMEYAECCAFFEHAEVTLVQSQAAAPGRASVRWRCRDVTSTAELHAQVVGARSIRRRSWMMKRRATPQPSHSRSQ